MSAARRTFGGLDRLGSALVLAGSAALAWLPLVEFKASRIASGEPRALTAALGGGPAAAVAAALGLVALVL
ncbi:MAG: ABC transporter permease, partial [Proteobacteria bacterium]|nr:ABC transporter permease [Pseudomonadota bacterium]